MTQRNTVMFLFHFLISLAVVIAAAQDSKSVSIPQSMEALITAITEGNDSESSSMSMDVKVIIGLPHYGKYLVYGDIVVCTAKPEPSELTYKWKRFSVTGPDSVKNKTLTITEAMGRPGDEVKYSCTVSFIDSNGLPASESEDFEVKIYKGGLKKSEITIIVIVTVGFFIGAVILLLLYFYLRNGNARKCYNSNDELSDLDDTVMTEISSVSPNAYVQSSSQDRMEIPANIIIKEYVIGSGFFGIVYKAKIQDYKSTGNTIHAALKSLKPNATDKDKRDLEAELEVLKTLKPHENVISFLGYCYIDGMVGVILELADKGNLLSVLHGSRSAVVYGNLQGGSQLPETTIVEYAVQVAKGMGHIASYNLIHRDLAARNILMAQGNICKVSDFGLAREDTYVRISHTRRALPIRWLPPETLQSETFSSAGDIWSFGVLLWEIVTLGATPYPKTSIRNVKRNVEGGHTMLKPEHCGDAIYNIMKECWQYEPSDRPRFSKIVNMLEDLIKPSSEQPLYLELMQEDIYAPAPALENEEITLAELNSREDDSLPDSLPEISTADGSPLVSNDFGSSPPMYTESF